MVGETTRKGGAMQRVLIYVHYNKEDKLEEHVRYQLDAIRQFYSKVIIVSNSRLPADARQKLGKYSSDIIERKNNGFDFAAWRDGMLSIGWNELGSYDELTIMNDTCFGPIRDMSPVYDRFSYATNVDFWGITNHREEASGMPGTFSESKPLGDPIPEYIQSYFVTFKRRVVESSIFQKFWESIEDHTDIKQVIIHYETKLTSLLTAAGYTSDTLVRAETIDMPAYAPFHNVCLWTPDTLLTLSPFIKRKCFVRNPHAAQLIFSNFEKINYPLLYITDYVRSLGGSGHLKAPIDRLVILRGNSGSGKSTIARKLKRALFYNVMVVGWDTIRIDVFNRFDYMNRDKYIFDTLRSLCEYGRKNNMTVILEGIYPSKTYEKTLLELSSRFSETYYYYFDVSFEESLRRHETRAQKSEFGKNEMKKWYLPSDLLNVPGERKINDDMDEATIVNLILGEMGEVGGVK